MNILEENPNQNMFNTLTSLKADLLKIEDLTDDLLQHAPYDELEKAKRTELFSAINKCVELCQSLIH